MTISSSSRREETKSGFDPKDVSNFLSRGNTLSRKSTGDIANLKPEMKSRKTITERRSGLAKTFNGPGGSSTSGFLGEFSSMSSDQIDQLTNSFLQRQREIKARTAQPGRSAFLIQR